MKDEGVEHEQVPNPNTEGGTEVKPPQEPEPEAEGGQESGR